ncbi:MAG: hypothetical protein Q8S36_06470 [Sulfuricurvum sp.]|nr:hypothetical protein [Sulfuricurvum sp.]
MIQLLYEKVPENEHNISNLHEKYKELYSADEFNIKIPFTKEVEYIGFGKAEIAKLSCWK